MMVEKNTSTSCSPPTEADPHVISACSMSTRKYIALTISIGRLAIGGLWLRRNGKSGDPYERRTCRIHRKAVPSILRHFVGRIYNSAKIRQGSLVESGRH